MWTFQSEVDYYYNRKPEEAEVSFELEEGE